jgi:CBS domain-containing protein
MLSVAEIMTREPYTLSTDDNLQSAIDLMREHHIRHIPILNASGSLVGLVSHRDVLAASDWETLRGEARHRSSTAVSLSGVMTSPVHSIDEDADLLGTAVYLRQHRVGCLPVTREGRLVGIISDTDFLEVAISLMDQLEQSEP